MKVADIAVDYIDHMGSDASVVRAARVSFAGDSKEFDDAKDAKLIRYLAKHRHVSPFNHTFITVKVKCPVFCARQLVKHRFMPLNEESRRYITSEPEFYFPDKWRKAAENVKQGSSDEVVPSSHIPLDPYIEIDEYDITKLCLAMYNQKLADGCSPEQARMILPQNMMVNYYWSGTLGAMADMLVLRLDAHTQRETQEVACKIRDIVLPLFPVSLAALLEFARKSN